MNVESNLIKDDILAYLKQHENKALLRFITCGSVDDGKSTLIGRLLYDSKMIFEDQLAALTKDSKKIGTTGEQLDLALLVDGLQSEREQGITIDVAYRYFATDKRKFIIADTPGHEQYTRNMATGASTADLAIILIDARLGVQTQTKRHSYIASLLGIKHIIVAINKMDLIGFSQDTYNRIEGEYLDFAQQLKFPDMQFVPISALQGDNIVQMSAHTNWYQGPALISMLESVKIEHDKDFSHFRFPVQIVNRPNPNFRGYSGTIASGTIKPGEEILALPSGKRAKVTSIVTYDGDLPEAFIDQAVTLTLDDEIDISRGDVIVKPDSLPQKSKALSAMLVWMHDTEISPERSYDFKLATQVSSGKVSSIVHKVDVNTLENQPSETLALNEIGEVVIQLDKAFLFDPYRQSQTMGALIVIDRLNNVTVGAGMVIGAALEHPTSLKNNGNHDFEIELNGLIRKYFPHWGAKNSKDIIKYITHKVG